MAQEPKGRRRADLCLRVPGQSAPHSKGRLTAQLCQRKAHSVIRLTLQGDFASRAEDAHCTCHHDTEGLNRCTPLLQQRHLRLAGALLPSGLCRDMSNTSSSLHRVVLF